MLLHLCPREKPRPAESAPEGDAGMAPERDDESSHCAHRRSRAILERGQRRARVDNDIHAGLV